MEGSPPPGTSHTPVLTLLSDRSLGLGSQVPEREREAGESRKQTGAGWQQSGIAPDLSNRDRSPGTMEAVAVVPSR